MSAQATTSNPSQEQPGTPMMKYSSGPVDIQEYNSRWEDLWVAGVQEGQMWDIGQASSALTHLISSGSLPVEGKRAIVPGCGRGYDVYAFAHWGASSAVGLELSSTAVGEAKAWLTKSGLTEDQQARSHFVQGDFFLFEDKEGPFDIGYDYTFGCAMHPTMRTKWAEGWARLLQTGSTLVTLIYPVDSDRDPDVGPPYVVTPDMYRGLLGPAGFDCVSIEAVPQELSHEKRVGKEFLGIWKRR